jgi:hypothetical protein
LLALPVAVTVIKAGVVIAKVVAIQTGLNVEIRLSFFEGESFRLVWS